MPQMLPYRASRYHPALENQLFILCEYFRYEIIALLEKSDGEASEGGWRGEE